MKIIACIPVYGRGRLLARTIHRLYHKNNVFKVICAGDQIRDKRVAESYGAEWIDAPNILGFKWNHAFEAAKKYDPDACLFMGSSDWIEDGWMDYMAPYTKKYDLIGVPDFYMADFAVHLVSRTLIRLRTAYSMGYAPTSSRHGDSVGGGRVLTRRLLDKLDWRPFDDKTHHSLDWSMTEKTAAVGGKAHTIKHGELRVLSLSTNLWGNKHSFDREVASSRCEEYDAEKSTEFLSTYFPEALTLFDDEKWNKNGV